MKKEIITERSKGVTRNCRNKNNMFVTEVYKE